MGGGKASKNNDINQVADLGPVARSVVSFHKIFRSGFLDFWLAVQTCREDVHVT